MPDITMCADHDCPRAKKCYRHEAPKHALSPYQSWFTRPPRTEDQCDAFMPIEETPNNEDKDIDDGKS